jgi:hypothetical protein
MPISHARSSFAPWLAGLVAAVFAHACERPAEPVAAPSRSQPEAASGNPLRSLAPAQEGDAAFAGVVAESLAAGGYTYLRVSTGEGDRWVATMGKGAPVGHRVHVKNMGTRHDFHSKRLGRRFDVLAFGIVREA